MLTGIDLFRLTGDRMRYLTERQAVLGRNIANADTPGYKAQDLAPFSVATSLLNHGSTPTAAAGGGSLTLVRTQAGHISPASSGAQPNQVVESTATYGEKSSGNTVSLEEQMVKSADVANAFSLATAAYSASMSLLKTAIDNK
jgi:flagellar basal-body rod protein FlgB